LTSFVISLQSSNINPAECFWQIQSPSVFLKNSAVFSLAVGIAMQLSAIGNSKNKQQNYFCTLICNKKAKFFLLVYADTIKSYFAF